MCLKEWRESAGLTQKELARLACLSRASISHVEHGRYAPSPRLAGKLSRALSKLLNAPVHTWDIFPDEFKRLSLCSQPLGENAEGMHILEHKDAS